MDIGIAVKSMADWARPEEGSDELELRELMRRYQAAESAADEMIWHLGVPGALLTALVLLWRVLNKPRSAAPASLPSVRPIGPSIHV